MKYNNKWLENLIENKEVKYLFFWGHQPLKNGKIGKSCFSQWFEKEFEHKGITYLTAEHWMMAEKARLFKNDEILSKILKSVSAGEVKKLGRQIINFDANIWNKHKYEIVKKGNYLKFLQNEDLLTFLLNTKNRILVEASPYDNIWGIGMKANDESVQNPAEWKGQNLLGYALMEVRDSLKE
ncbi:MAG: NADAR family protein [Maribacter litoralis]|uniref:NADAR family protein n=1 Tax=Maribacter litoralis TaxID=2059726 RepID=UPI0032986D0B